MGIKSSKLTLFYPFLLLLFAGCTIFPYKSIQKDFPAVIKGAFKEYPEAGAVYLLDQAIRTIHSDGSSELMVHQIIKICQERGRKFAEVQIPYNEAFQKVRIDFACTITREAKIIKVKRDAIHTVTPASLAPYAALYSTLKTKTISMPAIEIGSIIDYKYRIFQRKSPMKNRFWDSFYFQSKEPFVISKYILVLPEEMTFKKLEREIAALEVIKKGNKRIYIWEKKDVPGLVPEPQMPSLIEVVPFLSISSVKDWREISSWFLDLAKTQMVADSSIKEEVSRLIKGKKTEIEKVRAIYNYCSANIRYVGLEMGINAYQPHKATEVFHLKYGDCKDKATLLVTMLQVAGIKSYLVLINTDHQINTSLPSPGQFNHCIAAVPLENNYIFLDTTAEVCSFGDLPPGDQNRDVLIIKEGMTELVKTPIYAPEDNLCQRDIEIDLKKDGSINSEVKIKTSGFFDFIYRASFRYLRPVERRKRLAEDLNRVCPGANLQEFKISSLTNLDQPIEESYRFFAKNYAIKVGNKFLIKPAIIEAMRSTALVAAKERIYPILFQRKWERIDNVSINLPAGWKVETLPGNLSLRYPFGEFDVIYKNLGNKITYHRRFCISQAEIPVVDYLEFKKFYQRIAYQDRKEIILTTSPQ